MIEIACQKKVHCPACDFYFEHLLPYSQTDIDDLKNYVENKILKARITGSLKERSVRQLGLYWGGCKYLAQIQSDVTNMLSEYDIDFDLKTRIAKENPSMIKRFKMIGGILYIEPLSIAFPNLKHLDACRYFDKAFFLMTDIYNEITGQQLQVHEFIDLVKASFKS